MLGLVKWLLIHYVNWSRLFLQWFVNLMGALTFLLFIFHIFFLDCVLSMWGKIMFAMYRLWLHGLYGLYGLRCPLSPERLLNLITPSLILGSWFSLTAYIPAVEHMESIVHSCHQDMISTPRAPFYPPHTTTDRCVTQRPTHLTRIPDEDVFIITGNKVENILGWGLLSKNPY